MTENFSTTQTAAESPVRKFRRSREDAMIAGICAGTAKGLNVDATILRVLLVAATLLGFGAGIVIYLVCWVLVPQE
ncbi:PspC domain-containing protein [Saccharopolyspora shandongensis]|uniref:PspC domain-containing protein n=1 Tax=Saccharopolyspora shandongensis TaxID=418495 RepID=UPI0034191FBA